MEEEKLLNNEELLKKFCLELMSFGEEEKRREHYLRVYKQFTIIDDVRGLFNKINSSALKGVFENQWASWLSKERDAIVDFVKNANKNGGNDESDDISY